MKPLYLFLGIMLFLSGCASKTPQAHFQNVYPTLPPQTHPIMQSTSNPETIQQEKQSIYTALYSAYKQWRHTPYKYGGTSKYGIDCSSLVQQIYWDALRVSVPRTTILQSQIGYRVDKHQAKTGDLLLFKTARNTRHSGIYLKDGDFINASSKHGVTLSNLNNPYWRRKYWQTRRILP